MLGSIAADVATRDGTFVGIAGKAGKLPAFDPSRRAAIVTIGHQMRLPRWNLSLIIVSALMASKRRIVAVGLLTDNDLAKLGAGFDRAYPIDATPCFGELLRAIDDADREWRRRKEPPIS